MRRFLILGLILVSPLSARGEDEDAKQLAQKILDKGAALFAKKDAVAMAETYMETARVAVVIKDKETQEYKFETKEGRAAIQELYGDLYKNHDQSIAARNTVEFARLIAPDLLVIHGSFEPIVGKGSYAFVQTRKREGDKWLILNLQLFITSLP